jgi:hypothetical protein
LDPPLTSISLRLFTTSAISYIDNFRTPHSEKLNVVERFTIEPGGKGMSALVTVEDPDTWRQ